MSALCCKPLASPISRHRAPLVPSGGHASVRRQAGPAPTRTATLRAFARLSAADQQGELQSTSCPAEHAHAEESSKALCRRLVQGASLYGAAALAAAVLPSAAQAAGEAAAGGSGFAALLQSALSFVLHLDVHLGEIVTKYGATTYWILFAIVFAETGLVVTPFLPGDSLLFATGALAALGKLSLPLLLGCYVVAATLGDAVNYAIGNYLGAAAFKSRLLKREHIAKTEEFYEKYGGKTVVLARFVPIVRTFAPFVAGVGSMSYAQFAAYNVAGALLWTAVCVGAGYAFGNVPAVHENFSLVVLGIVLVSLLPIAWEMWAARREASSKQAAAAAAAAASVPHSTPAAAAAAVAAAAPPPQPAAVAAAAAIAAAKAKEKLQQAAAAAAEDAGAAAGGGEGEAGDSTGEKR